MLWTRVSTEQGSTSGLWRTACHTSSVRSAISLGRMHSDTIIPTFYSTTHGTVRRTHAATAFSLFAHRGGLVQARSGNSEIFTSYFPPLCGSNMRDACVHAHQAVRLHRSGCCMLGMVVGVGVGAKLATVPLHYCTCATAIL